MTFDIDRLVTDTVHIVVRQVRISALFFCFPPNYMYQQLRMKIHCMSFQKPLIEGHVVPDGLSEWAPTIGTISPSAYSCSMFYVLHKKLARVVSCTALPRNPPLVLSLKTSIRWKMVSVQPTPAPHGSHFQLKVSQQCFKRVL